MNELFLETVNRSICASWVVLAVLILRLLLKKMPKWGNVLLWGLVAFRLVCPVAIESEFSLIPEPVGNGAFVSAWKDDYVGEVRIIHDNSIEYDAAVSAGREPISDGQGGHYVVTARDHLGEPDTVENTLIPVLAVVWASGMAAMVLYTGFSYRRLDRKVASAVRFRENIYQSEYVDSPFVLGIIRPRIYLPYRIGEQQMAHVIAHEQTHIRRRDHWWKPLGFLLLTVNWFNPAIWAAYILLCRDIELACDEMVIRELGFDQRAAYSNALLDLSANHRMIAACPLAFGEIGVRERVKSVLNYRKSGFWIVAVSILVCIVSAVCLLTNPLMQLPAAPSNGYVVEDVVYKAGNISFVMEPGVNTPRYHITDDMHLLSMGQYEPEDTWTDCGELTELEVTRENFDRIFYFDEGWNGTETAASIRRNTARAWSLVYDQEEFYYLLQWKNGDLFLAYGYYDYGEKDDPGSDDTAVRWLLCLKAEEVENREVVMVPTTADVSGIVDSYLFLTIDGEKYRYEGESVMPGGIQTGAIIDTVYEDTGLGQSYRYTVFEVEGCVDHSMVLVHSGELDMMWLYQYSPPKASGENALQEAIDAGFVILEDGMATHGQESWDDFYEAAQKGRKASVTIAWYDTLDPERCDRSYYEAHKEDYPHLQLMHLDYDGKHFTLCWTEEGTAYTRTYDYLMKYNTVGLSQISSREPDSILRYVLTHSNTVTWEDLFRGLISSQAGAYIDHFTIYSERN